MDIGKRHCPIAVIGMACKYPGADSYRELWENILAKRRQFRQMPDCRTPLCDYYHSDSDMPDKTHVKNVAVIDGFKFDWKKRRIPFSTYQSTDFVHWLALEVAIMALNDAGYQKESLPGPKTGVIVGNTLTGENTRSNTMRLRWPFVKKALYKAAEEKNIQNETISIIDKSLEKVYKSALPQINEDSLAGGLSNTIAGRICNYLDLGGGGYTVDGACSSSLIAIATAANSLMNQDLDLALAGGVDISLDPFEIIGFAKAGALTPGEMRVYDQRANGFLPGEGCGFVLLKRFDDAKRDKNIIYAILHGWGVSSDGRGASITAPNAKGQALAIKRAYTRAPFKPDQIDFIEGHGTGTAVGDKTELEGVALSLNGFSDNGENNKRYCGITSLKSIIGHTKAAAGVGAFIKAVIAVNRRILPPTAACQRPNPVFKTTAKTIYPIISGKTYTSKETLRAGISAMGFGGINCHVCIESADPPSPKFAPSIKENALIVSSQETELFVFSGQSPADLLAQIRSLGQESPNISIAEMTDLAENLAQNADDRNEYRAAIVADHPEQLTGRLNRLAALLTKSSTDSSKLITDVKNHIWLGKQATTPRIGYIFPGQGSQQLNMTRHLVARYSWARDILSRADKLLLREGLEPVSAIIYRDLDRELWSERSEGWADMLTRTEFAQPAICLSSLIWLQWLKKVGVQPFATGGHSLGELTAFHAAGAYDSDTLIRFSGYRGKIFSKYDENKGAMISLRCSKKQADQLLKPLTHYATISNLNTPRQIVISGENRAIKQISKLASDSAIPAFRLAVTGAFHSKLMSTVANNIKNSVLLPSMLGDLTYRCFNGIDGNEIHSGRNLRKYFADQTLAPVNLIALVKSMSKICDMFIEVGPGQALTGMINEINKDSGPFCLPVESVPEKDKDINKLLATLFVQGVKINWNNIFESRLTRPYIPPSKRTFFENPCEKTFDVPVHSERAEKIKTFGTLETLFSKIGDISQGQIERYLTKRGAFIASVIKADIEHTQPNTIWAEPLGPKQLKNTTLSAKVSETRVDTHNKVESILYDTIESITGFSKETLTPDMRLLDDLNLDSIKTGDLLTRVATAAGIAGEVPPIDIAELTLNEICQNLNSIIAKNSISSDPEIPDFLKVIQDLVANLTGISSTNINADTVVTADLKISKEQLKKVLPDLSKRIKVDIHVDIDPLLKRTLSQIASILHRLYYQQQPKKPNTAKTHRRPWTREFYVTVAPTLQSKSQKSNNKRREDDWQFVHALVLADNVQNEVAKALAEKLISLGAQVDISTYAVAMKHRLMEKSGFSHFYSILPSSANYTQSSHGINLRKIITRLAGVAAVAPASKAPRRRNTIAYLQFGGGYFGATSESAFLDRCCATSLAASIQQERSDLRVRVLDFSSELSTKVIADKTIDEISTLDSFAAVGYDENLTRRIRYQRLADPGNYKPRSQTWTNEDVILVTGGAKGITAECTFGVARACGARMVLVGRSPISDLQQDSPETNEISNTLKRYADHNLQAKYFSCDISDREAVKALVSNIKNELGPITGVIHGAGLNNPMLTTKVSIDEAIREACPKVLGALNLMSALESSPPKLFIGLTSIIGVTGLAGNAWYGFSNEALDISLQRFEADHPKTRTLSVAYSIWEEKGMGARMGSVSSLNRQGISSISTQEGVDRFVRLFFNDPGVHQIIVAARFSGLETWKIKPKKTIENARFLEKPLHITPGVESAFRCHLNLKSDLYLEDHKFQSSYLFPAVFGLEAMAQAAAHVTGLHDFSRVRIENILLSRPITVDPKNGTDILVWAEVDVQITESALTIVRAGIYQPGIGVDSDSFSATFILGLNKKLPTNIIRLPKAPLDINPISDLYRDTWLFQGPRFQRIHKVWNLESTNNTGRATVTIKKNTKDTYTTNVFSNFQKHNLVLDDPFFRDALLQSAAILVPQDTSLPIQIDRLDIFPKQNKTYKSEFQELSAVVQLMKNDGKDTNAYVITTDSNGNILERLEGFHLRILSHHDDYPKISDLIQPDSRDCGILQNSLEFWGRKLDIHVPDGQIAFFPNLSSKPQKTQHHLIMPLLRRTTRIALDKINDPLEAYSIKFRQSGQPFILAEEKTDVEVSFNNDNLFCIAVAGKGFQNCSIVEITDKKITTWLNLIGQQNSTLFNSMIDDKNMINIMGASILACQAIVQNYNFKKNCSFEVFKQVNDGILFRELEKKDGTLILTFPFRLTRGEKRIFACIVKRKNNHNTSHKIVKYSGYDDIFETPRNVIISGGPQGQDIFVHRIPLCFKPSAQISRTVYFSSYLFWAGEVRETSAWPVLGKISKDFSSGKSGGVTNYTHLRILGEATTHDQLEVWMWTSAGSGPQNNITELTYDFRKMLPDGNFERVAWLIQRTTWVEIVEHGIVKPKPFPDYYSNFMEKMFPRYERPNTPEILPENLSHLKLDDSASIKFVAPKGPRVRPMLHLQTFYTALADANIVGNIYFAHYYTWIGHVRDRYFYQIIPEYYRGTGEKGELICIECQIDHLREAMPFDRIIVTMALKKLTHAHVVLYFEFFRHEEDGSKTKLAFGEQINVWIKRNLDGIPQVTTFPDPVKKAFHKAISDMA